MLRCTCGSFCAPLTSRLNIDSSPLPLIVCYSACSCRQPFYSWSSHLSCHWCVYMDRFSFKHYLFTVSAYSEEMIKNACTYSVAPTPILPFNCGSPLCCSGHFKKIRLIDWYTNCFNGHFVGKPRLSVSPFLIFTLQSSTPWTSLGEGPNSSYRFWHNPNRFFLGILAVQFPQSPSILLP